MEAIQKPGTDGANRLTVLKQKVDHLFTLDKITLADLKDFNNAEREYLGERCSAMMMDLTGKARDKFVDQVDQIVQPETKAEIWESNHYVISSAIAVLMQEYGTMPSKNSIAQKTGLTRQTIAKHIAAYKTHPGFAAKAEQFKFMAPEVLASMFKFARKGDTKAARLYFEMTGALGTRQNHTLINKQNNYIQINNTILSQENLQQLTAEQLNQIERIIRDGGVKGI